MVLAANLITSYLVMVLYIQVNGPKNMKITQTANIATPIAKMKNLHIAKTAVITPWTKNTINSVIESAVIAQSDSL